MRFRFFIGLLAAALLVELRAGEAPPEALLVAIGDMHSAYDRMAQFVARVDRVREENPAVPFAVLIDGDTFELGNVVAQRSSGAVEFAMLEALAKHSPVVLNLGNHEPEFFGLAETVARLRAAGVKVVGGNARDRSAGQPFAPASISLPLGKREATVVGITTDDLATFRVAVRPSLDLADPVVWAKQELPALLRSARLPIILSHAGLQADREILPLTPNRTLFVGAHDHLRFVHQIGQKIYVHTGSWTESISIARLHSTEEGLEWSVDQVAISASDPTDPALAKLIRETLAKHLTPEETRPVGRLSAALAPSAAARFAVDAARKAADADVAIIGGTTFGAGLPAGEVSRFALDACVRFDGALCVAEVDGDKLRQILARTNQGPDTPFDARVGENLVAVAPNEIVPGRRYRIATSDWIARNPAKYLGENPPVLTPRADVKLKAAVIAALNPNQ